VSTTPVSTSAEQLTGEYTIDTAHSRLGFVARHAMVTKVRGGFNDFEGSVFVDADDPSRSRARVVIQAASIDSRNPDRDAHLRSNDFLAMDEHPTITFESTAVTPVDDETFTVDGDLTVRGVTKPVTLDVEYLGTALDPWGNVRLGFEGSVTINRKDWGVSWNAALEAGGVLVSDKVTLELEIAAVKNS
jgi:polyisoprenoid-binding protein YceI